MTYQFCQDFSQNKTYFSTLSQNHWYWNSVRARVKREIELDLEISDCQLTSIFVSFLRFRSPNIRPPQKSKRKRASEVNIWELYLTERKINIYCIGTYWTKHAQLLVFTHLIVMYILSWRGKGPFNLLSVCIYELFSIKLCAATSIVHEAYTNNTNFPPPHMGVEKKQISSYKHQLVYRHLVFKPCKPRGLMFFRILWEPRLTRSKEIQRKDKKYVYCCEFQCRCKYNLISPLL